MTQRSLSGYRPIPIALRWDHTQGKELRDPSRTGLADYYTRRASWYTQGGYADESGRRHVSGYHYTIPYWEVFNEIDVEHQPTPREYTARYHAIVGALHRSIRRPNFWAWRWPFLNGIAAMVEYFLDHKNHEPGIPLDMISHRFYASPTKEETLKDWQYSFFDQADRWSGPRSLRAVRYTRLMQSIR